MQLAQHDGNVNSAGLVWSSICSIVRFYVCYRLLQNIADTAIFIARVLSATREFAKRMLSTLDERDMQTETKILGS